MTQPRTALLAIALLACSCAPHTTAPAPQPEGDPARFPTYPAALPQGPDLDVLVTRDDDHLVLVNRTPHAYHNADLWLNQQYAARIRDIPIATPTRVPLTRFTNRHGEPFPIGWFLAPDRAAPVIIAEMVVPPPPPPDPDAPETQRLAERRRLLVRN